MKTLEEALTHFKEGTLSAEDMAGRWGSLGQEVYDSELARALIRAVIEAYAPREYGTYLYNPPPQDVQMCDRIIRAFAACFTHGTMVGISMERNEELNPLAEIPDGR